MATFDYNPITGNLDLVGSGASYINGVVADPTALPVTVGTPPLDSVYLAKAGSGVWLINRRPSGLYCRTANNGVAADWTYLGAFPEVNAAANWEVYGSDATKRLKFNVDGLPTATLRTVDAPAGNGQMLVEGQSIGATTRNSGAFTTLNANNGTQTSTAFAPALTLAQTWNTIGHVFSAFTIDITNTASSSNSTFLLCRANGLSAYEFRTNGNLVVPASGSFSCSGTHISSGQVSVNSGGTFAFTSSTTSGFSGQDTFIRRDAASTIAFRDLANPQTFRIYNTTDAGLTNFERGFMRWSSNVLQIGTEAGGTGSNRNVEFVVAGSTRLTLSATTAAVLATTYRVGNGGDYQFGAASCRITGTASGTQNITFQTNSTDRLVVNDTLLGFGGTTSSFPALKRSSTTLQVRLADDSAYSVLDAQLRAQGTAPATSGATGTAGDIRYDADYIYVCTAANTWKRAAIATW